MNNIYLKKHLILKEFCELCDENNIWYSIDKYGILTATTGFDFNQTSDYYEVMMTFQSYEKLKKLFPNRVVDNTLHSDYNDCQIKFLTDINNLYNQYPFININLVVPTTIKKVKKYLKISNRIRIWTYYHLTLRDTPIFKFKFNKMIASLLKPLVKKLTYKEIVNMVYDKDYEGFYVLRNHNNSIIKDWINNLSYRTVAFNMKNIPVKILSEYKDYLKNVFGDNYIETKVPDRKYEYINAVDIISSQMQMQLLKNDKNED